MSAMSRAQRNKAEGYIDEADKKLNKKTWFASSTDQKYEDAAELYDKAANAYKVGGLYHEAGATYQRAADLYRDKLKQMSEASKALQNAGTCYKKSNSSDAIAAFQGAVTILCDISRLTAAAKLTKEVAVLYETESGDVEGHVTLAIESYEQAAELFTMEDQKSQASQCLAKVAELSSVAMEPPDLLRAAQIYEDLGKNCLESNLLKFNAKGYFLQSIFCHLANGDSIAGSQALGKYSNLDYTFGDSREGKFCASLVECVESFDVDGFATACFEFDRISKLDDWKTSILVRVKRSIEDQAGIVGGGADDGDDVDLT
jgi:alpha-soluble NSF attachment protein